MGRWLWSWMDGYRWTNKWINAWIDEWMSIFADHLWGGWMDGFMDRQIVGLIELMDVCPNGWKKIDGWLSESVDQWLGRCINRDTLGWPARPDCILLNYPSNIHSELLAYGRRIHSTHLSERTKTVWKGVDNLCSSLTAAVMTSFLLTNRNSC